MARPETRGRRVARLLVTLAALWGAPLHAAPVVGDGGDVDLDPALLGQDDALEDPDEGGDRFEGRTETTTTLVERAANVLDRTSLGGWGEHDFVSGERETARF